MEEAATTITQAITQMLEAGGPTALWALFIWMGLDTLKTIVTAGAWIWIFLLISRTLLATLKLKWSNNEHSISLVSEEVSSQLKAFLHSYGTTLTKSLSEQRLHFSRLHEILSQLSNRLAELSAERSSDHFSPDSSERPSVEDDDVGAE